MSIAKVAAGFNLRNGGWSLSEFADEHPLDSVSAAQAEACGYQSNAQIQMDTPIQFHLIELPKLDVTMKVIADSLDRWCYLLRQGEELNTDDLPASLATPAIQKALEVLAMMVQTPQERALYEARLDAKRERSTDLTLARREGINEGKREGLEEGKREELRENIELVLDSKFGPSGRSMLDQIKAVTELATLRTMFRQLNAAASLDELRQLWS